MVIFTTAKRSRGGSNDSTECTKGKLINAYVQRSLDLIMLNNDWKKL